MGRCDQLQPPPELGGGDAGRDLQALTGLLAAFGLPTHIPCGDWEAVAEAIGLDKKGAGEDITLVLLARLGKAILHKLPKAELLSLLAAEEHR